MNRIGPAEAFLARRDFLREHRTNYDRAVREFKWPTSDAMRDDYYHTGDIAVRDSDRYITFVGRTDDVFKASDYRLSPFELESVLIEFHAVAEAAVVPSPDPLRHAVPKAFVTLTAGFAPSTQLAAEILAHCRERVASYKRIRRIEFAALHEFFEEDFWQR